MNPTDDLHMRESDWEEMAQQARAPLGQKMTILRSTHAAAVLEAPTPPTVAPTPPPSPSPEPPKAEMTVVDRFLAAADAEAIERFLGPAPVAAPGPLDGWEP